MDLFKYLYQLDKSEKYKVGRYLLVECNNELTNIFQTKIIFGTIYIVWEGYNKMSKTIYEHINKRL